MAIQSAAPTTPNMINLRIKVKDGTLSSDENLCKTCSRGMVIEGDGKQIQICNVDGIGKINFSVRKCSGYDDKRNIPLWALREQAWVLETNQSRTKIGFVKYKELSRDKQKEIDNL